MDIPHICCPHTHTQAAAGAYKTVVLNRDPNHSTCPQPSILIAISTPTAKMSKNNANLVSPGPWPIFWFDCEISIRLSLGFCISQVAAALVLLGLAALACGYPQGLAPEAKDDYHHHDHYFQYINVPKHKHFEWGYKRGNDKHFREEYLTQHDHAFKAKVREFQGRLR